MVQQLVQIRVHGPKVFRMLTTKPHLGFLLVKTNPAKQVVELQTKPSWFSWGETLVVTVVNGDGGCRVIIESRRTVFHNFLAKPEAAAGRLVAELTKIYDDKMGRSKVEDGKR